VQIKEKIGGTVTAISMGPIQAVVSLRDALARGADRALLLSDTAFAGADTLATSYVLASAVRKLGAVNLVVCGEKTIDGDTAQVGPEVSEFLGFPCVAFVEQIQEVRKDSLVVKSRMGRKCYLLEVRLPGLITVTKDINMPRLPTLKDKIRSRKAEVVLWNADDVSDVANKEYFGLSGSPTSVIKVYAPSTGGGRGQIIEGTSREKAKKIASILKMLNIAR